MDKEQAITKIKERLEALNKIPPGRLAGSEDEKFKRWRTKTLNRIEQIFGYRSREHDNFRRIDFSPRALMYASAEASRQAFEEALDDAAIYLENLIDNVEETWSDSGQSPQQAPDAGPPKSKKVFVVHGHDPNLLKTVELFLENQGLKPIILKDQPSSGMTMIEKFEKYSSEASFAVVLMTGDDIGGKKDNQPEELQPRARQNVILELGYFLSKLGRNGVCPLYQKGVETPSDYTGVVYVPLDDAGEWTAKLKQELEEADLIEGPKNE
jgi:predicted nucleotide-binding protein